MHAVNDNVAKAIVQGISRRSFSHWRSINTEYSQNAELDIGSNYRILVSQYISREREYYLLYRGNYLFGFLADRRKLTEDGFMLCSDDCHVSIRFNDGFNQYLTDTDNTDRRPGKGEYWGVKENDPVSFGEDFIDALLLAVRMHDFSELKRYESTHGHSVGPADFRFTGIDEAESPSCIFAEVSDEGRTPVSFRMNGVLYSDGDGIVIRGDNVSYTIIITDDDWNRFYTKHPDILTTAEDVARNPPASHKDILGDREEYVRRLVEGESTKLMD